MKKTSWKTNLAGIVAIVSACLSHFFPEYSEVWKTLIGAATGLGLLSARDNGVTSEQAGAK